MGIWVEDRQSLPGTVCDSQHDLQRWVGLVIHMHVGVLGCVVVFFCDTELDSCLAASGRGDSSNACRQDLFRILARRQRVVVEIHES